jgi:hypothetical protein
LISALDKTTGEIRLVSDVPSGQKCGCICAECKEDLQARKGKVRAHHFAHMKGSISSTRACQETALHNAAKRLLAYHLESISVPSLTIRRPSKKFGFLGREVEALELPFLRSDRLLALEGGEIEPSLGEITDYRPDAFSFTADLGAVYFEVHVTNPVPAEKKAAYQKHGLWVLELDLSDENPATIGLERLKELVERDAKRHWLSWQVPQNVQKVLDDYDQRVASFSEEQHRLLHEDLRKPIPEHWLSAPSMLASTIRFRGVEFEVGCRLPTPSVVLEHEGWCTTTYANIKVPVFGAPHPDAITEFVKHQRDASGESPSFIVVNGTQVEIWAGTETFLHNLMRWILERHQNPSLQAPSCIHCFSSQQAKTMPLEVRDKMKELRSVLWADPALSVPASSEEGVFTSAVPSHFAQACVELGAAKLVVREEGIAYADREYALALGELKAYGAVYTAIRLRLNTKEPLPCRLILEEGGYTRSLSIARRIHIEEGELYLSALGLSIPLKMRPPSRGEEFPIYLVPGLSYPDESALFQAHPKVLSAYIEQQLRKLNPDVLGILNRPLISLFVSDLRSEI